MDSIWAFLSDPEVQRTLGWLGGGLVVGAGGLWAFIKFIFSRPTGSPTTPSVSADRGGIAAGRDIQIDERPSRQNSSRGRKK